MSLVIKDKKFIESINILITFLNEELDIDKEDMRKKFSGIFKVRDHKAINALDFSYFIIYLDLTIKSLVDKNLAHEVEEAFLNHLYIRNYLDGIFDIRYTGTILSISEK